MNPLKQIAITASYVTCLPLCRVPLEEEPQSLGELSKYLSLIGLILGLMLTGLSWLLSTAQISPLLQAAILTISWLILTGGIHFDGLMDAADGIFSHRNRDRMLEIMSDSRVGNFGALTGFSFLILKLVCLSTIPAANLLPVFLTVPAWARFCETFAIGSFPYLRKSGQGKIWHDTTRMPRDVLVALVTPLLVTLALAYAGFTFSLVSSLATVIGGIAAACWINAILKGHTGDTYGAVVEIAETAGLLLTALILT